MPIAVPNRIADPVSLEAFDPPCILRQEGGLFIPYKNTSTTDAIIAGEPVNYMGRICIAQKTIMPGKIGTLIEAWIADVMLKSGGSGNISQNALVYWNTAIDIVTNINTGVVVSGIGAAQSSAPSYGFILGRAVQIDPSETYAATATSIRVRVVSLPGAPTVYP